MNKKARLCAAFEFPAAILTLSVSIIFVLSLFLSLFVVETSCGTDCDGVFEKQTNVISAQRC